MIPRWLQVQQKLCVIQSYPPGGLMPVAFARSSPRAHSAPRRLHPPSLQSRQSIASVTAEPQ